MKIIKLNSKFNYENIFEMDYDENLTLDLIKNKFCEKNELENSFIIYNGSIFHENISLKEINFLLQEKYLILFIYDFNQNNLNKSKYDLFNQLLNAYNRYYGIQNPLINFENIDTVDENTVENGDTVENEDTPNNENTEEHLEDWDNAENENIENSENPINNLSEDISEQAISLLNQFTNHFSPNLFGEFFLANNDYSEQMKYLESIGFVNKNLNNEALLINNGDIEGSINYLIDQQ